MERIKKILVVDDEPILVDMIMRHLRRRGFVMASAVDGDEAKNKISRSHGGAEDFDLIISDLFMPRVDGFNLLKWIKKKHPTVSVMILTGFGNGDQIRKLLRPGLDGFCRKPLEPGDMMEAIRVIEAKRRNHREPKITGWAQAAIPPAKNEEA